MNERHLAVELEIPFTDQASGAKARVSIYFNVTDEESPFISALNLNHPNGGIINLPL